MPGATLDSVTGDDIAGRIKVKVGPITMTYAGTAKFTERDRDAGVVTLEASGKETRGAGTASASVRSQLSADGDKTHVTVHTNLNVTGKPAQFGRGVMAEVGGRLIGIFADNLAAMIAAESAGADEADDEGSEIGGTAIGSAPGAPDEALPIDVLNLHSRAWSSLRHDGIQTLGDLVRRTPEQLLAIENIGPASVAEITAKLADRGLSLEGAEAGAAVAGAGGSAGNAAVGQEPNSAGNGQSAATQQAAEKAAANGSGPSAPARPAVPAQREPVGWQPQDDVLGLRRRRARRG
jgi:carbon monoxide dehydrogenase subunit G